MVKLIRIARSAVAAAIVLALAWPAALAQSASKPPGFPSIGGPVKETFGDSRDQVDVSALPSQEKVAPGGDLVIAIILDHQPGWHTWPNEGNRPEGTAGFSGAERTSINVTTSNPQVKVHQGYIQWPATHTTPPIDLGDGPQKYAVFSDRAIAYVPVTIDPTARPGKTRIDATVHIQACNDSTCSRGADPVATVEFEIVDAAMLSSAPPSKASDADFKAFDPSVWSSIHAGVAAPQIVKFDLFGLHFEINAAGLMGLLLLCLIAALGGALLNLTPCVLPVIPIKIMSLAQSAGHRGRTLLLGFAMFLGVIAFWIGLGGAIASIKGFTATNQLFQYPWFTITVGVIIAIMAIGMAGFFTVRLPQAVYMINPRNDTLHGSFLFGVMTAILSTPCTAPFMGAAAAWAATQAPAIVLTVFFAIGLGMGLPYFILSAFPKLVDKMPRTGPASELIKQVMGLLMLAAAAYFIGVGLSGALVRPPDPPSRVYLWLVAAFVAAAGGWLVWRTFAITSSTARRSVFGALGAMIIVLALAGGLRFTDHGPIKWIYYTPDRLAKAQSSGKIVVMEFTAEWCLNCKALEEAVLRNGRVASLLNSDSVAPIKIDLTGNNTAGNEMLTKVQRRSIPLLVIFAPDGRELFKGDFYTIDQVVAAINAAGARQVASNIP